MNEAILAVTLMLFNPTVIDGDTLVGNIPGIPDVFGKNIPVRIAGIDTAELHSRCTQEAILAGKAKARVQELLSGSTKVELRNPSRDKYFRLNAEVIINGVSIGGVLLQEGLAHSYSGQTKRGWC